MNYSPFTSGHIFVHFIAFWKLILNIALAVVSSAKALSIEEENEEKLRKCSFLATQDWESGYTPELCYVKT